MMRRATSDRGASLIMVTISLSLLFGAAALAVDIGALWMDRSADQKITDSAAAAGVLQATASNGQEACETALAYVAVNSDEIGAPDDSGCAVFPATCSPGGAALTNTVTSGRYTISVTYPVPDGDPLMTSGIVGASSQALDPKDGGPCDRVGVELVATRKSMFAQLMGFELGTTRVHTVATASTRDTAPPINLLVLDRTGCRAIAVEGNGGIIVDAIIAVDGNGNPTGLAHGIAAADSDGSAGCVTDGVIDVDGSNSRLRADGPTCPSQSGTHSVGAYTAGEGCGRIQAFAPGTPGCAPVVNVPACTPGSGGGNRPAPEPTALPKRLTRAPVDHRYNCWGDYTTLPAGVGWATNPLTGNQSIPGCNQSTPAHIYDLIQTVGQSGPVGGFTNWTALGHPCNLGSGGPAITVTGNVRVDCSTFTVRRNVQINGNVIFDGSVAVTSSSGRLNVNNSLGSPGWAFFRTGTLSKDAQAHLTFNYTAVYMSKTSSVTMSGGTGSLTWIAPDSDNFDDLALWSDSPLPQFWAGQANLAMEGVFFMPWARANYSGSSGQNQTNAQWIAHSLLASGQGTLVVRPGVDRGISFGQPGTTLIR